MGTVVDLDGWRRSRASGSSEGRRGEGHPSARSVGAMVQQRGAGGEADETARLERAVRRLDALTHRSLGRGTALRAGTETELLAIIGELSVGLIPEAAARAERLCQRLDARGSDGRSLP